MSQQTTAAGKAKTVWQHLLKVILEANIFEHYVFSVTRVDTLCSDMR